MLYQCYWTGEFFLYFKSNFCFKTALILNNFRQVLIIFSQVKPYVVTHALTCTRTWTAAPTTQFTVVVPVIDAPWQVFPTKQTTQGLDKWRRFIANVQLLLRVKPQHLRAEITTKQPANTSAALKTYAITAVALSFSSRTWLPLFALFYFCIVETGKWCIFPTCKCDVLGFYRSFLTTSVVGFSLSLVKATGATLNLKCHEPQ